MKVPEEDKKEVSGVKFHTLGEQASSTKSDEDRGMGDRIGEEKVQNIGDADKELESGILGMSPFAIERILEFITRYVKALTQST